MAARRPCLLLCLALLLAVPGCSPDQERGVPLACRQGEGAEEAVRRALASAPEEVRMDGTRLSECLNDTSSAGELQEVGAAYVGVASDLAPDATRRPEGREATQLGYLMGAMRRSATGAQGVGYELQRRLEQELSKVDTGSRAYRRGEAAGRRSG